MTNPLYGANWRGNVSLKLTGGSTACDALNTQYNLGVIGANAQKFDNKTSPDVVNASSYPSESYAGKITGAVRVVAPVKMTWFTANLWNELLNNLNLFGQTNQFAIQLRNNYQSRVYDGCYCVMAMLTHAFDPGTGQPGPAMLVADFLSLYPENLQPSGPTTFSSVTTDAGQLPDCTKFAYGSGPTADMVEGWTISGQRVQKYVIGDNQTDFFDGVASGGFGGSVVLVQRDTYNVTFGSSGTIQVGSTGAGVSYAMLLDHLMYVNPQGTDIGTATQTWRLIDLSAGGNPLVCSAM